MTSQLPGKLHELDFTASRIFPGTLHPVRVYIPEGHVSGTPAALYVRQDGFADFVPQVIEKLIAEKAMPMCIALGVASGRMEPTLPGGYLRRTRSAEYDALGRAYADFVIEEVLPCVRERYGFRISESPDMHLADGCSSGGICAWNMAWERNDFFRRVYMNSPTFSSFRGGDALTVLMRKYETKPIRAYLTVGTDDMRNSAGDWHLEALSAREALTYAGYEFACEVFEGGAHGAGAGDPVLFERVMRYLWHDWEKPVRPLGLSPRVADLVSLDTRWERTDEPMPQACVPTTPQGTYSFAGGTILLHRTGGTTVTAAAGFADITAIALSSDRWRLYVAERNRRFVDVVAIRPDGTLADCYAHAHLHLADDCRQLGASAICVDEHDRLFAATQLGIQTFGHEGHSNTVLPLPGHLPVTGIAFGRGNGKVLYASANGAVFKRDVKVCGLTEASPVRAPDAPLF